MYKISKNIISYILISFLNFFSFLSTYISNTINKNNYPLRVQFFNLSIHSFTTIFPVSCFSDVTQPARNIFTQNDSCPCPSLHGRSTSCTMPQGKSIVEYHRDKQGQCFIPCKCFLKTKNTCIRWSWRWLEMTRLFAESDKVNCRSNADYKTNSRCVNIGFRCKR